MTEERIKTVVEAAMLSASKEVEDRAIEAGRRFMKAWMKRHR